jgi:para-aminobenzoate synthetase component 1
MRSRGRVVRLTDGSGRTRELAADPLGVLRELLEQNRYPEPAAGIPFSGGAVGYLGYDLGRLIEKVPVSAADDLGLPECYLAFYDNVVAFDHFTNKTYLVARDETGLRELREVLARPAAAAAAPDANSGSALRSNFSREAYVRAVERAREYIIEGEIYQVNLSQRFECDLGLPPAELYRRLRKINPAPFAAYLGFNDVSVASASPERFLRVQGGRVQSRPIKGTRPRGGSATADARLAAELLASPKDRAENLMIVDLVRNDLGRVAACGTVLVTGMAELETFATVFHLTSTVEAILKPGADRIDLIRAAFPGGSITGAPKVRAMEIIAELEPNRRGVYTGAIGYLGFDGGMDLNIAIRTIVIQGGKAYFQAGGGIVYDSVPEAEYQEMLDKARALAAALGLVI